MTYQSQLADLTEDATAQVRAALTAWAEGRLTLDEVAELIAAYVAAGNSLAAVLADMSLAAVLTRQLGKAITPAGIIRPAEDPERLAKAAHTILGTTTLAEEALATAGMRLTRLVAAEIAAAAADSYSEAIRRSTKVRGWTRGMSAGACELCRWWWREGRVWQPETPFQHHKGCTCHPVPVVVTDDHDNLQTTAQAQGAAETRAQRERRSA